VPAFPPVGNDSTCAITCAHPRRSVMIQKWMFSLSGYFNVFSSSNFEIERFVCNLSSLSIPEGQIAARCVGDGIREIATLRLRLREGGSSKCARRYNSCGHSTLRFGRLPISGGKGETYVMAVTTNLDSLCFTGFLGTQFVPGIVFGGDTMQHSTAFASVPHPATQNKPLLTSLDSGQECSLEHWLEVTCLVEQEELDLDIELLLTDSDRSDLIVH
jgi:hypothetical protein